MLLNFDGKVDGMALDPYYRSDALDRVSANASAAGMIFSSTTPLVRVRRHGRIRRRRPSANRLQLRDGDPFVDQFAL